MALTPLRLRTTSMARSTSCNVPRRTTVSPFHRKLSDGVSSLVVVTMLGKTSVSIHPQSPSFSIQQHARSPARPTPPRQCTNTEMPCRVYLSMIRSRSASRDWGESGVRPSASGMRRTSRPSRCATWQYFAHETPMRNSSSSSSRQHTTHRAPNIFIRRKSTSRSRQTALRPCAGPFNRTFFPGQDDKSRFPSLNGF